MGIVNTTITLLISLPLALVCLFYLGSIIHQTVTGVEEISGWEDHTYYFGLLVAQIVGVVFVLFTVYLIWQVVVRF